MSDIRKDISRIGRGIADLKACIKALAEDTAPVTPVITSDIEYLCNEDTNVYDQYVTVITDGVAAAPVITATTAPCDSQKPDVESVTICDLLTNTVHIVTTSYAEDGTATLLSDIDTFVPCNNPTDEIDVTYSSWLPVCVDGVQWYVAERISVVNATGVETVTKIFKNSAIGNVVAIAPAGTIVEGICDTCFSTPQGVLNSWN